MEISIFEAAIKDFIVFGHSGIINLFFFISEYISIVLIFLLITIGICIANYFHLSITIEKIKKENF